MSFKSRVLDESSLPPPVPAVKTPDYKFLWETRNKLIEYEQMLEDQYSLRSNSPAGVSPQEIITMKDQIISSTHLIAALNRQLQDTRAAIWEQGDELRATKAALYLANQKTNNLNKLLTQQAETIGVQSAEISKFHDRSFKYESVPCKLPSQFGKPLSREVPISNFDVRGSQDARVVLGFGFDTSGQVPTQPPPRPIPAAAVPCMTKWGPIDHSQKLNPQSQTFQPQSQVLQHLTFDPPLTFGPAAISTGSPNKVHCLINDGGLTGPLDKMRIMNLVNHNDAPDGSVAEAPYGLLAPIGTRRSRLSISDTSTNSGGAALPSDFVMQKLQTLNLLTDTHADDSPLGKVAAEMQQLFDATVEYSYVHVNYPSNSADATISPDLKNIILDLATRTTAFKIMADQKTRYWMITKLILLWMQENVFTETSFARGLNEYIDRTIVTIAQKLSDEPPSVIRAVYQMDLHNQFVQLTQQPNYEEFMTDRILARASELWTLIKPLIHQEKRSEQDNMIKLMKRAHKAAETLFTDGAEFKFIFPKTNEKFNDSIMISMDTDFRHMSDADVMASSGRVRLGFVPRIMFRTTHPAGASNSGTLLKAGVLLRVPERKKRAW